LSTVIEREVLEEIFLYNEQQIETAMLSMPSSHGTHSGTGKYSLWDKVADHNASGQILKLPLEQL
jgi:hypothetical protein